MLSLIFLLFGLMQSCNSLGDIASNVNLIVDTDVLHNPLTVQYVDADGLPGEVPRDLKIKISGSGADRIFSVLGEKEIEPDGNFVNLGVRKIDTPSPENPIEVTVRAEAPGYQPSQKNFVIAQDSLRFVTVPMVKIGGEAEGISSEMTNFQVTADEGAEAATFDSPMTFGKEENARVVVQPGTKIFDAQGQQLSGDVEVSLTHFDNRSSKSLKTFPGGLSNENVKDLDGSDLGPTAFTPLGVLSLDMTVNGKKVRRFSEPLQVTMTINPSTINPHTGKPVQVGDKVEVASFNETTSEWEIEDEVAIVDSPSGGLEVRYSQGHLSRWVIGFTLPGGCRFFQLVINSDISRFSAIKRKFFAEIIDAVTDMPLTELGRSFRFYNKERIVFFHVPNTTAFLRIYDGNEICKGKLLIQTNVFELCDFIGHVDVGDGLNRGDLLDVSVEFSGVCEDDGLEVRPTLPILYKDSQECPDNEFFDLLGDLHSGKGQTFKLIIGNYYDFKICFGGINRDVRNIQVPTQDTVIIIDNAEFSFQETIAITYHPGPRGVGKRLHLKLNGTQIPSKACNIWRCHLNGGTPEDCDP